MDLTRMLLEFIDRHMSKLPSYVQTSIVLIILLLLTVCILNGFVVPTYISGTLMVKETPTSKLEDASKYKVDLGGRVVYANDYGIWALPLDHGGIPRTVRIKIYYPKGEYIDSFYVTGPWPIWNAVFPMKYNLDIHIFEKEGKRIRLASEHHGDGESN
jgi:hypothetical protein